MAKSAHELTRKEMKAPDRFQVVAGQAAGWVARHQKRIVAVVAVLIGVMLIGGAFSIFQAGRDEKAASSLYKVMDAMGGQISTTPIPGATGPVYKDQQEQQRAIASAAEAVIKAYPSSTAARTAALALGGAHFRLGEFDAAIAAYERALDGMPAGNSLQFAALEGLAYAQEGKGDVKKAIATMDRLAKDSPDFKDRAALEKARLLAKDGQVDEAKKILTAFPTDFATSTLQGEAKTQLERLNSSKK